MQYSEGSWVFCYINLSELKTPWFNTHNETVLLLFGLYNSAVSNMFLIGGTLLYTKSVKKHKTTIMLDTAHYNTFMTTATMWPMSRIVHLCGCCEKKWVPLLILISFNLAFSFNVEVWNKTPYKYKILIRQSFVSLSTQL